MIKLVSNPKRVPFHLSSICMQIYIAAIAAFNMMPAKMQDAFNQQELRWFSIALIGTGVIGKYFERSKDAQVSNND